MSVTLSVSRLRGVLAGADRGRAGAAALHDFESPTASVIAAPLPVSGRATIWIIAATVGAAIAAMSVCPVDRVVSVPGKVVSQASNMAVQPLETSIVRSIDVREGQIVHTGDLLARLDPTVATADAAASEAQVASLQAEVDRLEAEVQDRPYVSDGSPASALQAMNYIQRHAEQTVKLETYRQKIDSARARVMQADSDIAGYAEQLKAASTKEGIRRELERLQIGSKLNTLDAGAQRAEIQRTLQSAVAGKAAAWNDLQALAAERQSVIDQFKRETLQQLTEQGRKLADAREQRTKANLRKRLVDLRADRDAVVLNVAHVSVGSVLQSGDAFMTLVPADSPLQVEADVPGRDAGFVQPGDAATIKFDTFPYSIYGYETGRVRDISADSFTDPQTARQRAERPELAQAEAIKGGAYYRAAVDPGESRLHSLPAGFRMVPGMPVTVDIKVGQRTIMAYLLGKIVPALSEGMREP